MAPSSSEVAERYSEALFDLALENGELDAVERDLLSLEKALANSEDLRRLIKSPVFDNDTKQAGLVAVLERAAASRTVLNFARLLSANGRASALPGIIAAFNRRLAKHRGRVAAEAISAKPLTDEQERDLRSRLEAAVGKTVELSTQVDPSLLGGLIVKVGSRMIDSSLRTKLNRLQQTLKEA
ncbi:ATP synthase F1, delta subunit [Parvularcula bermudensis HTCC2503]|uniref:ATP synthase subunit delta n=1 Tax=Parvularcula bermudensis (strain ATCC BAA-594 / HTCC2503 / KCTC 12087) TaxID=314260 RepID=E0TFU7_PARBH|nr:F0F1 ATP synthase subunit delta [Parvularcula bermudensis]ADM09112.1 ATP synthase F1, delta subunit [Parvularcula bermudensis HTCC2503]